MPEMWGGAGVERKGIETKEPRFNPSALLFAFHNVNHCKLLFHIFNDNPCHCLAIKHNPIYTGFVA